jgi:hypothetical protein
MFGVCELPVSVKAGETLYVDVDPRREYMAADIAGTVVGSAVTVSAPTTAGVDDIVDAVVIESATAGAAGAAAAATTSAVEGTGKRCAGPFRLTRLAESAALGELSRLRSSHEPTASRRYT